LLDLVWELDPNTVVTRGAMKTPEVTPSTREGLPDLTAVEPWEACFTMGTRLRAGGAVPPFGGGPSGEGPAPDGPGAGRRSAAGPLHRGRVASGGSEHPGSGDRLPLSVSLGPRVGGGARADPRGSPAHRRGSESGRRGTHPLAQLSGPSILGGKHLPAASEAGEETRPGCSPTK
jgi:hypothetical protein